MGTSGACLAEDPEDGVEIGIVRYADGRPTRTRSNKGKPECEGLHQFGTGGKDVTDVQPRIALAKTLEQIYDSAQRLLQFVRRDVRLATVARGLRERESLQETAMEVAETVVRRGWLDDELIACLLEDRPTHFTSIRDLALSCGCVVPVAEERRRTAEQVRRHEARARLEAFLTGNPTVCDELQSETLPDTASVAAFLMDDAVEALDALGELTQRDVARKLAKLALPWTTLWQHCARQRTGTPNAVIVESADEAHGDVVVSAQVGAAAEVRGTREGVESARYLDPAIYQSDARRTTKAMVEGLAKKLAPRVRVKNAERLPLEKVVHMVNSALNTLQSRKRKRRPRSFWYIVEQWDDITKSVAEALPELWIVTLAEPEGERHLRQLAEVQLLLAELFAEEGES